jgi:hypothetical protein
MREVLNTNFPKLSWSRSLIANHRFNRSPKSLDPNFDPYPQQASCQRDSCCQTCPFSECYFEDLNYGLGLAQSR